MEVYFWNWYRKR